MSANDPKADIRTVMPQSAYFAGLYQMGDV